MLFTNREEQLIKSLPGTWKAFRKRNDGTLKGFNENGLSDHL